MVAHPSRPQLFQSSMDPNFYTWSLRWWPYAVAHGLNPLHSTEVSAPAGSNLAWVTSIPPLALLVSPLTALAGPVVSFSLLVAAAIPTAGWATFVLARRLTGRFWPALTAGALYGFSAYELNHIYAGQLNLAFSLLLPLMAYLVLLWRDASISSGAFVVLLTLAMVVQFYLFLETFADMTVVWLVALAAGYVLVGRSGRRAIARLAGLVAAAFGIALVFASPYLVFALGHIPPGFIRSPARTSLDLAGLLVPRTSQTFGMAWLAKYATPLPSPANDGYIGIPLVLIAIALAVVAWSSRLTRFLIVMLVLLLVGALGPAVRLDGQQIAGLPWARLWLLPIAQSAYPARLMVFVFLALAVIVAVWLARPRRRWWLTGLRWLLALLAVAVVATNVPALDLTHGRGLPTFISSGAYRHYLHRGATVVVISGRGNAGMLWQAETDFYTRLAGGYLNHAIAQNSDLPPPVAVLESRHVTRGDFVQFRRFLRSANVRAILVEADWAWDWPAILSQAGLRGQTIDGVIVYWTPGTPRPGVRLSARLMP